MKKCRQPKGSLNSFYGKSFSREQIEKWKSERKGSGNPMYGSLGGMYGKSQTANQKSCQSKYKTKWWAGIVRSTPAYKQYRRKVELITSRQPITTLIHHEKRGISGKEGAYQLDHKMSVWYGYQNNIPPEVIGDISNLRFIPWMENQKKWKHSV